MSRRWKWPGAHLICLMRHGILWWKLVHNCNLGISSPQGSRRMAPPQASPPLWPLSLVCHQVWPVQSIVYIWSWDWNSKRLRYHCISCRPNWNSQHKKEFVLMPLRHTTQGFLPDFRITSTPRQDIRTLVLPMMTLPSISIFQRISFSCSSSSNSEMMIRSSAYRFHRVTLYENLVRVLSELRWTVGSSGKSLCEHPLSHWTLHSGCNQRALCWWHFHTCSDVFSRSTTAVYSVLLMAWCFSGNWRSINMALVVLHPGMEPNYVS